MDLRRRQAMQALSIRVRLGLDEGFDRCPDNSSSSPGDWAATSCRPELVPDIVSEIYRNEKTGLKQWLNASHLQSSAVATGSRRRGHAIGHHRPCKALLRRSPHWLSSWSRIGIEILKRGFLVAIVSLRLWYGGGLTILADLKPNGWRICIQGLMHVYVWQQP